MGRGYYQLPLAPGDMLGTSQVGGLWPDLSHLGGRLGEGRSRLEERGRLVGQACSDLPAA